MTQWFYRAKPKKNSIHVGEYLKVCLNHALTMLWFFSLCMHFIKDSWIFNRIWKLITLLVMIFIQNRKQFSFGLKYKITNKDHFYSPLIGQDMQNRDFHLCIVIFHWNFHQAHNCKPLYVSTLNHPWN